MNMDMKAVKWAMLLLVAAFPYSPLLLLATEGDFRTVQLFWLIGLAGAAALLLLRKKWDGRELALASMLVKLIQIPAYLFWFVMGVLLFLFMGPVLAFVIDVMAIILTGLVGLAAVLRCRKEGRLTKGQAALFGILQFFFCVDIVAAIILYLKTKEVFQ